jgi:hypothetical protein
MGAVTTGGLIHLQETPEGGGRYMVLLPDTPEWARVGTPVLVIRDPVRRPAVTALWTIDDDEDFGPTLVSPMGTRCRARDMGVTDGSFAALVADVRAARLADDERSHEQRCDDGDCENSEAVVEALITTGLWTEIDGDGTNASILADHIRNLDRLRNEEARLADDMAAALAAVLAEWDHAWAANVTLSAADRARDRLREVAALHHVRQQQPRRHCPDDGTCHHECGTGPCWRVNNAGPLSGVFPGDEWPHHARQQEETGG